MLTPIEITPKAALEIKHIMATKNIPLDYFLRVGVKGGGCGGMAYALGFDKLKPEDQESLLKKLILILILPFRSILPGQAP